MFTILTYDINQKRVSKVMKICRKYLVHIQKSVFEGQLTEAELKRLKRELKGVVDTQEDTVCIYQLHSIKYVKKEEIGKIEIISNII